MYFSDVAVNSENLKTGRAPFSVVSVLASSAGFTLLEILVSVVFISIGFLGLASTVTTVIQGNELSGDQTAAVILAQEKLEELKNKEFNLGEDFAIGGGDDTIDAELTDDGDTGDVSTDVKNNPSLFTNPDHSDAGFTGGITTTPQRVWNVADDTPAPGMKTLTVIVAWKDINNHYVVLTTAIQGSVI
jgi:type II secretory pathway pseudopilin PulG